MASLLKRALLVSALLLSVAAHARTWTSSDGRTIEASLVSKGEDFVVLRLDATGGTVTVKHSLLSADDIEFIKSTNDAPTAADRLTLVINKYPKLTVDDETARQLNAKYESFVKIMTADTAFKTVQLMRRSLSTDIKYWEQEAGRRPRMPHRTKPKGQSSSEWFAKQQAEEKRLLAQHQARKDIYKWVSKTLPDWMAEVEKAASQ